MEKQTLIAEVKKWNPEKKRYEPSSSTSLTQGSKIEFGGVLVSFEERKPHADVVPDSSPASIVIRKREGVTSTNLHILEQRTSENPKEYVAGKTILVKSPIFYLSYLPDIISIQMYDGNPYSGHPQMLEITPATHIGENTSSPLL